LPFIGLWEIAFIVIIVLIWIIPRRLKMSHATTRSALATIAFIVITQLAYSYQTGTSADLWIAYLVTGIPIAIGVVIAILILFLFILRYATKRKIAKSRLVILDGLCIKPNSTYLCG